MEITQINTLKKSEEQTQDLEQQKIHFLSLLYHQLWTPLTTIKGYSSMILEGSFGKINSEAQTAVEAIYQSSQQLIDITENYLNASRIELGKLNYKFEKLDLDILTKQVIDKFKPFAERKELNLDLEIATGENYSILADSDQLAQVVNNLIDNAIKFTEKGKAEVSLSRTETGIRLTVKDTGMGISSETMPTIFEKFARSKDFSQSYAPGTGLGLYISKQIIEAHNGKIWAESDGKNLGSTFIVELKNDSNGSNNSAI